MCPFLIHLNQYLWRACCGGGPGGAAGTQVTVPALREADVSRAERQKAASISETPSRPGADKSRAVQYSRKGGGAFPLSGISSASLKMKLSCLLASSFIKQPPCCLHCPPTPAHTPSCLLVHGSRRFSGNPGVASRAAVSPALKPPREEGAVRSPGFSTGKLRPREGQGFCGCDTGGQW